jgi:hypothetical protein
MQAYSVRSAQCLLLRPVRAESAETVFGLFGFRFNCKMQKPKKNGKPTILSLDSGGNALRGLASYYVRGRKNKYLKSEPSR